MPRLSIIRAFATTSLIVATSLALNGCVKVVERDLPKNHYDNYYGSPTDKTRFTQGSHLHTDINKRLLMQENAPFRYVVKKGDTLWSIAKKFITKPWYWPEIWDKNQKIKNPHLIYPGDVLTLHYVKGKDNKLTPVIRVDRGIVGKPVSSIMQFLAWPRILDAATIKHSPYILASRDDHNLIHDGETVYVKQLRDQRIGGRYAVYHENKEVIDPETGQSLGYEVIYKGKARVERSGKLATAKVLSSMQEIRAGDRLLSPEDNSRYLNAIIRAPKHKVRGTILGLYDAEAISGKYMIAAVNRGHRHKLEVGHVVGIYADGKVVEDVHETARLEKHRHNNQFSYKSTKEPPAVFDTQVELPPEIVGNMVIYKVTPNVSYGLIIESDRAIRLHDKIGNPK